MESDYLDADVAYLLGLIVARGELSERENTFTVSIHFPQGALLASGEELQFDTSREIRLGLEAIRERLLELTGADIRTVEYSASWDLVIRWTRNTMVWRNLLLILNNQRNYEHFHVPSVLMEENTPP